jgi:sortase A
VFRQDPLLKVGVIVMALALALAVVAVVVSVASRGVPEQAVASERVTAKKSQVEPSIRDESLFESVVDEARQLFTPGFSESESNADSSGSELEQGSTPVSEAGSRSRSEPAQNLEPARQFEGGPQARRGPNSQVQAGPEPAAQARSGTRSELPEQAQSGTNPDEGNLPGEESDWPRPTQQEVEAANEPRHYHLPAGAIMGLTIHSIGIYNAPVFDSDSQWALANGIAHVPETSFPWSPTPQRNVYLAGHRMGYRGTWSRMIFYNLNKVEEGDKIVLKDRTGRKYQYRVSEIFLAGPSESWVMGQVRGRDMLTLQTCTPIPTFEKRLIVRADRA